MRVIKIVLEPVSKPLKAVILSHSQVAKNLKQDLDASRSLH